MNKRDFLNYFRERYRGECHSDGTWRFFLKESNGHLVAFPLMVRSANNIHICSALAMRPKWFDELTREIYKADGGSYLFNVGEEEIKVMSNGEEISIAHIEQLINISFSWYDRCCDTNLVSSELSKKYAKYNVPGGWQFTHIVACVLKGDVEKLSSYFDSFERGDRMGFIPLIKKEYFERAIVLAEKYNAGELKSPVEF